MGVELNNSGISYAAGSVTYKFVVKSENDFGFYTCEATNSRGSASYLIELYMPGIQIKSFHFKAQSYEMFFIHELRPTLNVQSDSIRAKVFN